MGLLRGMARTAVIAGTATAVSNNVTRRQMNRYAAQEEQNAAAQPQYAEPAPSDSDPYAEIERLAKLRDQGILTQDEFDAKKRQLLGI